MKVKCITLFDITRTNVRRHKIVGDDVSDLIKQRNQQCNFETVLQIISLRSQPENITDPIVEETSTKNSGWGKKYQYKNLKISSWSFTFTVQHKSVFTNGENVFDGLLADCQDVPMIIKLDEWDQLGPVLDTSAEYKNINFERIEDDDL
jgi:hypothetical protein